MRHAAFLLLLLLVSEAWVVRASLMMLYPPIRSAVIAFRSIRLLFRIGRFMRRLLLARRFLQMLLLNKRQDKVINLFGLARDSCLRRFICEMRIQGRYKRDLATVDSPEERVAITFKISRPLREDVCEKRFENCPYNAQDMIQALTKFGKVWPQIKLFSKAKTTRRPKDK